LLVLKGEEDFDDPSSGSTPVSNRDRRRADGRATVCAVVRVRRRIKTGAAVLIYKNFKRGAFYPSFRNPSAPTSTADNERELVLRAQLGSELTIRRKS